MGKPMKVIYEVAYVVVDRVGLCTVGKSKESFLSMNEQVV